MHTRHSCAVNHDFPTAACKTQFIPRISMRSKKQCVVRATMCGRASTGGNTDPTSVYEVDAKLTPGDQRPARTIPRAASAVGLRHSGARLHRCPVARASGRRTLPASVEDCCGIRRHPAPTGNARSAARAEERLRPNLPARLQVTSSHPPRSRDSRVWVMIGLGPCQEIKIYVVIVYIKATFLAPALHVFSHRQQTARRGSVAEEQGFFP